MKLPSMQWYPGDWLRDTGVMSLTYEERGIWFHLLMLMHDCEPRGKLVLNGAPMEIGRLGLIMGLTEEKISHHISQFISLGVAGLDEETGAIMCRRMVRDEERRAKLSENGKKGGNPAFKRGKHNPYHKPHDKPLYKPGDKPKITPSSSSSSSSSDIDMSPQAAPAPTRRKFAQPTPADVREYGLSIGFEIDGEKFCDHYAAKGWVVGKSPMKDWRAAVRTWRAQSHTAPVNGPVQRPFRYPMPGPEDEEDYVPH